MRQLASKLPSSTQVISPTNSVFLWHSMTTSCLLDPIQTIAAVSSRALHSYSIWTPTPNFARLFRTTLWGGQQLPAEIILVSRLHWMANTLLSAALNIPG